MLHVLEILCFVVWALLVHLLRRFVYFRHLVLRVAHHQEAAVHPAHQEGVVHRQAHLEQVVRLEQAARQVHLEQVAHLLQVLLLVVHQVQVEAHQAEAALLHVQVIVLH